MHPKMFRLILGMLSAIIVFPLIFALATLVGTMIVREAMFVGYELLPNGHETLFRIGNAGVIVAIIHGAVLGAFTARRVFRAITRA